MAHASIGPVLLVVGTRPEGIKMMPLYAAMLRAGMPVQLCATLQHDELLTEVFDLFGITPDYNLNVMRLGQDLFYVTQAILQKTKELFMRVRPSLVIVQGDTTSTMAAALAAFYCNIPVAHIEAGLRTESIDSPFPEEMNRRFVSLLARYHCAPTEHAANRLRAEGIDASAIFCTGNTVVDALRIIRERLATGSLVVRTDIAERVAACQRDNKKIMLLTMHRRESFDGGVERVLHTVKEFLVAHPEVFCFYSFHPNPNVVRVLHASGLTTLPNSYVCEPLVYKDMVYVLQACNWVVTDSGGIQEEAVSLGKRVLITRENTERPEGVWAGLAQIVGTDRARLAAGMHDMAAQEHAATHCTVYGDGYAAEKIVQILAPVYTATQNHYDRVHTPNTIAPASITLYGETMKKLCVLGLGYIGLPTSLIAAEHGFTVIGVDVDAERVRAIMEGNPVIDEPDLFEKLHVVLKTGAFSAHIRPHEADYFIIAVPTPIQDDKTADLSYVYAAADSLVPVLRIGSVVIIESTIPVGATKRVAHYLQEKTGLTLGEQLFVAHCPERVLPGNIVRELIDNARIIGGIDKASMHAAKDMYKVFVRGQLYLTDATTAEMVKLVENSSRDVQLAFAHQVASMAQSVGLNPYEVIELANKHPRVNILQPTCGVGGHCIAVDPWFLVETFPHEARLLKTARDVNDAKPHEVIARIRTAAATWRTTHTKLPTVLLLGVTYKPNVNDVRESPALYIARTLAFDTTMRIRVCEPHLNKTTLTQYVGDCVTTVSDGLQEADIIVYLVAHERFSAIDATATQHKIVIDCCGILHTNRKDTQTQEQFFWPASSVHDHVSPDAASTTIKEYRT